MEILDEDEEIQTHIDMATMINSKHKSNPEAADRAKMIQSQLHSSKRAELADLLGVNHSLYSEINPLHLPEVLSLVGHSHGQGELYVALKASIAGVTSTVNRKQCIEEQMAYHAAKLEELGAELAAINEAEEVGVVEIGSQSRSKKRRRADNIID